MADRCEAYNCQGKARHWTADDVHLCDECWEALLEESDAYGLGHEDADEELGGARG